METRNKPKDETLLLAMATLAEHAAANGGYMEFHGRMLPDDIPLSLVIAVEPETIADLRNNLVQLRSNWKAQGHKVVLSAPYALERISYAN